MRVSEQMAVGQSGPIPLLLKTKQHEHRKSLGSRLSRCVYPYDSVSPEIVESNRRNSLSVAQACDVLFVRFSNGVIEAKARNWRAATFRAEALTDYFLLESAALG